LYRAKNILNVSELPAEARAKLFARKSFRDRAARNALNLFASSGSDDVI
jgi:hypothetical protein